LPSEDALARFGIKPEDRLVTPRRVGVADVEPKILRASRMAVEVVVVVVVE
jgi:hypothetical protein